MHLSSYENSFIVLQVQGVFANALSVETKGCFEFPLPGSRNDLNYTSGKSRPK